MQILTDSTIQEILRQRNVVVSMSTSGGKDSGALGLELNDELDRMGFQGERIYIHSDLGAIEHTDSLPTCERLSAHTGVPLIVVKPLRPMIERWEYRWQRNRERFVNLETVKIATWASSAMWRFCTSEEKTAPICQKLKKLYPGKIILNAIGIRGQESMSRAKKPIWTENKLLQSKKEETSGLTWHPIRDFTLADVFLTHKRHNFAMHEAYHNNGNTRVSCVFCVLASEEDLRASLRDIRTHDVYRRIVSIEALTTFSFQPDRWLGDLALDLLPETLRETFISAKERAIERRLAERMIPDELLFDSKTGFPAFQPTIEQARRLADARRAIGDVLGFDMRFITAKDVWDRYAELLEIKRLKEAKKGNKSSKVLEENPQASLFALN